LIRSLNIGFASNNSRVDLNDLLPAFIDQAYPVGILQFANGAGQARAGSESRWRHQSLNFSPRDTPAPLVATSLEHPVFEVDGILDPRRDNDRLEEPARFC